MQVFEGAKTYSTTMGGREIGIETGILAGQAGGAVTVRYGDTILMATATMSTDVRPGIDFFPLSVEFEEKLYAGGRIPGSFFRREGRPSEQAILLCRLVDRSLRPLFPKGMRNEVQIIITTLSSDGESLMDPLAITAAAAALAISDVPWNGPVAGAAVGYVDGEFVVNPTSAQMDRSTLNLQVAGTDDNILMVEAGAHELPEEDMLEALKLAHDSMQPVIELIKRMQTEVGKAKFSDYPVSLPPESVSQLAAERTRAQIAALVATGPDKTAYKAGLAAISTHLQDGLAAEIEAGELQERDLARAMDDVVREEVRRRILEFGIRPDNRDTKTVRPIMIQVGKLPRVHGSGLFQRGETQVLTIATLGTPGDAQRLDTLQPGDEKRYIHHYNFPPYSTGEAYPMRGPKRREIGHGALAERALIPVLPDDFPYTLRLVSEALSSNGSTSMASVCGSTLALMDAGVPILAPVAGIAMGLIQDQESGAYRVLTDIQGMEDYLGDMDFKVAGTEHGITALQMDMKIKGLDFAILKEALDQAQSGRLFILEKMLAVISAPRQAMSPFAPRILTVHIDSDKIGKVIGPGGKVIRALQDEFEVKIDIDDDGTVYIAGSSPGAEAAEAQIRSLTEDVEVGKIYTGTVVRVEPYGAFVNILPGTDGLVHISQLADYRVGTVEEVAALGEELTAMVIDVDPAGKVRLSRQAVLEGWTAEEARERDRAGSRGNRSGRPGGDRGGRGGNNRGRSSGPRR